MHRLLLPILLATLALPSLADDAPAPAAAAPAAPPPPPPPPTTARPPRPR